MKKNIRFVYGLLSVFLMALATCPAMGQKLIQKKLEKEDYKLWSKLQSDKISDRGNWVSYYLKYELYLDTLFVQNTNSKLKYSFASSSNGRFSGENLFACLDKNKKLHLLDLISGRMQEISDVKKYDFSSDGQKIITLESSDDGSFNLCIRNSDGKLLNSMKNTEDYEINNTGDELLYVQLQQELSSVYILSLDRKITNKKLIIKISAQIKSLTWSKDSNAAAFYAVNSNSSELYYYNYSKENIFALKSLPTKLFNNKIIAENAGVPLKISDDNTAVFFCYVNSIANELSRPTAEIWNSSDKYLYPANKMSESYNKPFLGVWQPLTMLVRPLSSEKLPWAALTGNQNYTILADPSQYEPQYDQFAPMDYYIMNTFSGEKELLIQNQSGFSSHMNFSPNGRYICYYKGESWLVFDIQEKRHINIIAGIKTAFQSHKEDAVAGENNVYAFQGWSSDGHSFLICDQYDIWQIYLNGKSAVRLTCGREKKIRFRLQSKADEKHSKFNYSGTNGLSFDLDKKNILEAYDTVNGSSGYYILDSKNGLLPLIFDNAHISKILKAKYLDTYSFVSENFDKSPAILIMKANKSSIKILVETNRQQKNFYWGFSEMIHYTNSQKKTINGALFYPANYNPSITYPMIVYIYEKLSNKLHHYEAPCFRNPGGFNINHYTSNGYFVLMPDIVYEMGNPGVSAAECVENAVKSIIDKGIIDQSKIGIIGHSYGGYETNFILTCSNLFTAAVSGSGISDNIFVNFTINPFSFNSEIWRFENQQYRMGVSLYENTPAYIRNSPLLNAQKINTPLLIWTGKNDSTVKPEQSTAFFLALRRLKKKSIMLQYPDEGHSLSSQSAKEDLNNKIMEWFDFYLKGKPRMAWISNNKQESYSIINQ